MTLIYSTYGLRLPTARLYDLTEDLIITVDDTTVGDDCQAQAAQNYVLIFVFAAVLIVGASKARQRHIYVF